MSANWVTTASSTDPDGPDSHHLKSALALAGHLRHVALILEIELTLQQGVGCLLGRLVRLGEHARGLVDHPDPVIPVDLPGASVQDLEHSLAFAAGLLSTVFLFFHAAHATAPAPFSGAFFQPTPGKQAV